MLGQKRNGKPAVFTIVERLTGYYLAIRTNGKTTDGIAGAMEQLCTQLGDRFAQVFCTTTTDNGSEFAAFSVVMVLGTEIYFAHPYSALLESGRSTSVPIAFCAVLYPKS